ncbi:MAG: hypothetical protein ABGZ35_18215 [Planctomycetaceae bacterium]
MHYRRVIIRSVLTTVVLVSWTSLASATVRECRRLLMTGRYEDCLAMADEAIEQRAYGEEWPVLKLRAERELGRYSAAAAAAAAGIERYPWSIRLYYEAYLDLRELGRTEDAANALKEIDRLAAAAPWRYSDADDLVALGKAALAAGADPRDVLKGFFDRARRNFSGRPDGVLASAELAIEKGDVRFAAELLAPALDEFSDNAEILWTHYLATRSSDPQLAEKSKQAALLINPNLTVAILAAASEQIDREQFAEAAMRIAGLRARNPHHAKACGLLVAIHHLRGEVDEAARVREAGLEHNPKNPVLDHHTGVTLSRRYRFHEGATLQRQALKLDPDYLPARVQLAQDLLRLGESDEGWQLADDAHQRDGYDTQLFNLLQLRDSFDRFEVLRNERFELHMARAESLVFGEQAMRLLESAWEELTGRYGHVPTDPVIVEIFDRPDDFAVRTFGLPDVTGFLGVCFGRVITANSPTVHRRNPNNWESVLWHEFCHVITLQMTGNRIPRWLSEGISVYEERRRDGRCGQRMTPAFRDRILRGEVTSVGRLSSAFLEAKTGDDLNFAYYESSMVVEYFIDQRGHDGLIAVLKDLNAGLQINDALERNSTDLETFNKGFQSWLRTQAESFAAGVDFDAETLAAVADNTDFSELHPNHYSGCVVAVRRLLESDPEKAEAELLRLIELFPQDNSIGGARKVLAQLYRSQRRPMDEKLLLEAHVAVTADDIDSAIRLMDLNIQSGNRAAAVAAGRMALAIDPARGPVLRQLADAAVQAKQSTLAIECLRGLLELEPLRAPVWRFRIAQLSRVEEPREARRQLLLALEEAPRYREAHQLLLEVIEELSDNNPTRD